MNNPLNSLVQNGPSDHSQAGRHEYARPHPSDQILPPGFLQNPSPMSENFGWYPPYQQPPNQQSSHGMQLPPGAIPSHGQMQPPHHFQQKNITLQPLNHSRNIFPHDQLQLGGFHPTPAPSPAPTASSSQTSQSNNIQLPHPPSNTTVQVRNIFYQANNDEILEYMRSAGTVVDYFIKKEEHRVIGSFTYADPESARCAVELLDNHKICGSNRELKVKLSGGVDDMGFPNDMSSDNQHQIIRHFAAETSSNNEDDLFQKIEQSKSVSDALYTLDDASQQNILAALKIFAETKEDLLVNFLASRQDICEALLAIQRKLSVKVPPPPIQQQLQQPSQHQPQQNGPQPQVIQPMNNINNNSNNNNSFSDDHIKLKRIQPPPHFMHLDIHKPSNMMQPPQHQLPQEIPHPAFQQQLQPPPYQGQYMNYMNQPPPQSMNSLYQPYAPLPPQPPQYHSNYYQQQYPIPPSQRYHN